MDDYVEGMNWLKGHGFHVWAVVCDGMRRAVRCLASDSGPDVPVPHGRHCQATLDKQA